MNARQLRVVLAMAVFATLALAAAVHDGEAPELGDLIDNRLHHEKIEAWILAGALIVFILLTWPRTPDQEPSR